MFLEEKKDVEEKKREREERARPENKLGKKHAIEHVPNYIERASRLDTTTYERDSSVLGNIRPCSRYGADETTANFDFVNSSFEAENMRASRKSLMTSKSSVSGVTRRTTRRSLVRQSNHNGKLMPVACTFKRSQYSSKTPTMDRHLSAMRKSYLA